jgi:hypothetical protein
VFGYEPAPAFEEKRQAMTMAVVLRAAETDRNSRFAGGRRERACYSSASVSSHPAAVGVIPASGARSDRQFVGIMVASHSAFTGGAAHGGTRPD